MNDSEALWTRNSSEAINHNGSQWSTGWTVAKRIATVKSYLIVSVAARYNSPWLTVAHCGLLYAHHYKDEPPCNCTGCQYIGIFIVHARYLFRTQPQ